MVKQTAGRDSLGSFAPEFARLNDDVLFGEVWSREDKLSLRDRSLVTLAILMGKGITDDPLKYHLQTAKSNGITREEMAEIITHAAFYAGWPNAWAVFKLAKQVYGDEENKKEICALFGKGMLNTAFSAYFSGESFLNPVYRGGAEICNVTFTAKCRNNWHIHHNTAQILLCTDGEGWYREWGAPVRKLAAGDIVVIPPEVKHWHGAGKTAFSHVSVSIPEGENGATEWCERVSDEEYEQINKQENRM